MSAANPAGTMGVASMIPILPKALAESGRDERVNEFLAMVSHEIRTPLNGILGFARLLSEARLDGEDKEHAQTILASAEAMSHLLDDLLDFSCMEAGGFRIEAQPFSVRAMVEEVQCLMAFPARQKSLSLRTIIASDVPETLIADSGRIRQVLINLVGNAIKFTDHGHVTVTVARDTVASRIAFYVEDTGIGIPPENVTAIFEPFTGDQKSGGKGLGLAISKRLVELMGGSFCVKTQFGSGSLFLFWLPL